MPKPVYRKTLSLTRIIIVFVFCIPSSSGLLLVKTVLQHSLHDQLRTS
jgi:hypothetical protein